MERAKYSGRTGLYPHHMCVTPPTRTVQHQAQVRLAALRKRGVRSSHERAEPWVGPHLPRRGLGEPIVGWSWLLDRIHRAGRN